jgi:hypothetical protein
VSDPRAAVVAYLQEHDHIVAMVDGRIFRPKLPQAEDEYMPRACIIVSGAGGVDLYAGSYLPLSTPRIDIRCYGSTGLEADNVAQACKMAMKRLRAGVWADTKVYWAKISADLNPLVDADTLWPFSLISCQVQVGD